MVCDESYQEELRACLLGNRTSSDAIDDTAIGAQTEQTMPSASSVDEPS